MAKANLETVTATATVNATYPNPLPTSSALFGVTFDQNSSELFVCDLQRKFAAAVGALVADRFQLLLPRCIRVHSIRTSGVVRTVTRLPLQPGRRRERPGNEYGGDDTHQIANDLHYFCPPFV
jgi:hypothetical protein